jgi:DNA-binding transcriptional MerR regulator
MVLYSTGSLAQLLKIHRDCILNYLKAGMPEPSARIAGRRVFTLTDVEAVCRWLDAHGKSYCRKHELVET